MITLEWIKSRCKVNEETGCWEWQKAKDRDGYGYCRPHRKTWEIIHGIIPEGMCVCHTCDNPSCCNPEHLWIGTSKQNTTDRHSKGRTRGTFGKGDHHPRARLTETQVREIRSRVVIVNGGTGNCREVSEDFGIEMSAIWKIARRKRWKHVL